MTHDPDDPDSPKTITETFSAARESGSPLVLPEHPHLFIEHRPHANRSTAAQWIAQAREAGGIELVDVDEMLRTEEVWLISPVDPKGAPKVAAATLEEALARMNERLTPR